MGVSELPPEIWSLIIGHVQRNSRVVDKDYHSVSNQTLLNLALTCKTFASLVIPRLYRELAVPKDAETLKLIVVRLLEDYHLARTVRTLTVASFEAEGDEWDEEWAEELEMATFFTSDEGASLNMNIAEEWKHGGCFEDNLVGILLLCCPNLREMRLDEDDYPQRDLADPTIFLQNFWPWQELQRIELYRSYDGEMAQDRFYYANQLFQSAGQCWPAGFTLDSLSLRGFPPQGFEVEQGFARSLRVRRLEIADFGYSWYSGDQGWNMVSMYIRGCRDLEEFSLVQPIGIGSESNSWYENMGGIYSALQEHASTLKSIRIDIRPSSKDIEDPDNWPSAASQEEPNPSEALDYKAFEKLETLDIAMPFLFGRTFFLKLPILVNNDSSTTGWQMDLPTNGFAGQFRPTLTDNLPPSLKRLVLGYDEVFQDQAVKSALQRLQNVKTELFPQLETIESYDFRPRPT